MTTMRTELATELRSLRKKLGLSQSQMAEKANVTQATISRWESGNMRPTVEQFQKLVQIDERFADFLSQVKGAIDIVPIRVIGDVSAGTWKQAVEWPMEDQYEIAVPFNPKNGSKARRVAFINRGDSMNLEYRDGDTLIVVLAEDYPNEPKSGDHVIVQRQVGADFEATCKEFVVSENGQPFLMPRSSNPAYQPIILSDTDGEVAIIGFVEGHYRSR